MAQATACKNDDAPVDALDRLCQELAEEQEVFGFAGLTNPGGEPTLIALEKRQEVDRRILDWQIRIVDRRDPGVVAVHGQRRPCLGELAVALHVQRLFAHFQKPPAQQRLTGLVSRRGQAPGSV